AVFAERFAPLRPGEGFLLHAGGCAPHKNLDTLIASYARLDSDLRRRYRLVIVTPPSREIGESLSAIGLKDEDVILTGRVSDEELAWLYSCCSLFVYPSLSEGFGFCVLEAMRCGAPVLASSAASLPEIAGPEGALFAPLDCERLSALIHAALIDPVFLNRLKANSNARQKLFSWDKTADAVWRALEKNGLAGGIIMPRESRDASIAELCMQSVKIGGDIMQIQGAGGNVSLKCGDTLLIKASGTCLARAMEDEIFIKLPLSEIRRLIDNDDDDFSRLVPTDSLKPSLETPLHALLPWRVVLHVHCLNAVARTVMRQGPQTFKDLLGLPVTCVPYARPGMPLARAVADTLGEQNCPVLVLENHGLLVGADSVADAFALLHRVRTALELAPRPSVAPNTAFLHRANDVDWLCPHKKLIHDLATDPASFRCALAGPLYPDHAVFLGGAIPVASAGESVSAARARIARESGSSPIWLIYEGQGVLVSPECNAAQAAMLEAFALVCKRVRPDCAPRGLARTDIAALLDWDGERYRRSLMRKEV
ncbi:MAG: class II aldolase/adducin family protein, partial [Desulfovibrionaceae bacterium]|nr:class II aldolase/adducin family protein [Desulfovibrionaceae bacterium]